MTTSLVLKGRPTRGETFVVKKKAVWKKKTKRIVVTARDIRNGVVGDACNCPIARAATRAFKTPCRYYAGPYLRVGDLDTGLRSYAVPVKCVNFADDFDNEKPVKPFTFTLELT